MKQPQLRLASLLALSAVLSACGGPALPSTPVTAQGSFTLSAPQGAAPTAMLNAVTGSGTEAVVGLLNNPGTDGNSAGFSIVTAASAGTPVVIRQVGVLFGKISATIKAGDVFSPMPTDVFLAQDTASGASVMYREGTDTTRVWESVAGTGTVTVTSVSPTLVTVKVDGVVLSKTPLDATGPDRFTLSGSVSFVPEKP